ncbi:MAG TPA: lamin tail domain-containing protein, partial [Lacipirellulaceae bacterium]|nr:lamin tail domain-containing protein [Lacipirellulaceae bacterium]
MGRRTRGWARLVGRKKQTARIKQRRLGIETLEPRHVLSAANLVISEFMAANSDTLADGDGRFSDWIEIQNAGATAVNLSDYRLTDTQGALERWAFPSRIINPGEYLVVFASSPSDGLGGTLNNYVDAGGHLHTNFSLDADGEYLALTYEDPVTHVVSVVHEYATTYPPQRSDISYGIAQIATELDYVMPGAAAQTIVPTNSNYDAVWNSPSYTPDGNWINGTTGVGYGQTASGFLVRMYEANLSPSSPIGNTLDNIDEALEVIGNPAARFSLRAGNFATVNFLNTGSGPVTGHYAGDVAFPGQTNPTNYNHFATHSRAVVTIPTAGDWTFGIRSNEGFFLTVGNFEMQRSGTDSNDQDVLATFNFPAAGTYDLNLFHFEGTGDAWLELFAAQGARAVWDAAAFDLVGDVANGGLAVTSDLVGSNGASISQLLGTNVQPQMAGVNSTFYTRIPFIIDSLANYDQLKLRMKYDDAFVAYLNGTEIARRNVTGATDWDSTANAPRVTDDVLAYEEIDISLFASSLHVGSNLLAIHGINFSASDPDALILPELVAVDQIGTSAGYFATPTPRAANGTGFVGFVEDVTASVERGLYDAPVYVAFTTPTAGAEIRYTLDGTEPTATYGVVYTAPLHVAQTSIVRAAAFKPGFFASPVSTHTYIFLNDVIRQSPNGEAPPGFPTTPINGQVNDYGMDPDIWNSPVWG